MYCPQCQTEFREHFTECSDCHVPLLPGAPPADPPDAFDPAIDLVEVFETADRTQLSMAKGMLEDAGIPFFLLGQIATLVNDIDPFLHKWVRVQVPCDREAEARSLLETLLQLETAPADDADEPDGGGGAQ